MKKWIYGLLAYIVGILYVADGQRIVGTLCLLIGLYITLALVWKKNRSLTSKGENLMAHYGIVRYPRSVWNEMQRDAAPDKEEQEEMRREHEKEIYENPVCPQCKVPLEVDLTRKHDLVCSKLCGYWVYFLNREDAANIVRGLESTVKRDET